MRKPIINGPMGGRGHAVSTFDLHQEIIGAVHNLKAHDNTAREGSVGIWYETCELIARRVGLTTEAVVRRLYDVIELRSHSLNAHLAEATLVELIGEHIIIPVIPRDRRAALESAVAYTEDDETEWDVHRLARSLVNFARGYLCTFDDVMDALHTEALVEDAGRLETQAAIAVAA